MSEHRLGPVAWPTLGFQIVHWAMTFLCHGPGDVEGQDLFIDDEIALHICWLYRLWPAGHKLSFGGRAVDVGGRRLARRGILSRPKGRAKSEIAGMFVCAEACGPVRFDHWARKGEVSWWGYPYEPGEPVGKPVKWPFIRIMATEEGQSGNTYANVPAMLSHRPFLKAYGAIDIGRSKGTSTRVNLPHGGVILPSTASNASKDGGKESAYVFDETHLYVSRELKGMKRTVSRNGAKRKEAEPLGYDTTTAFEIGEGSAAEADHKKYGDRDPDEMLRRFGVLYDHRQAPKVEAWYDDESKDDELVAALRDVYGIFSEVMDLRRVLAEMRDEEATEEEGNRYFLNIPSAASSKWCIEATFDGCPAPERPLTDGDQVALGFDGSETDDSTVLFACRLEDGALFPLGIWEHNAEDWRVPHGEVDAVFRDAMRRYDVARAECDRPYFENEVDTWHADFGQHPVYKERVFNFPTKSEARMAPALKRLLTGMEARRVPIDCKGPHGSQPVPGIAGRTRGDAVKTHFLNAHKRKTNLKLEDGTKAVVVSKEMPNSPRKIDSVPAAALAYEARGNAIAAGALKPKRKPTFHSFT